MKFKTLALLLIPVFILLGCGESDKSQEDNDQSETSAEEKQEIDVEDDEKQEDAETSDSGNETSDSDNEEQNGEQNGATDDEQTDNQSGNKDESSDNKQENNGEKKQDKKGKNQDYKYMNVEGDFVSKEKFFSQSFHSEDYKPEELAKKYTKNIDLGDAKTKLFNKFGDKYNVGKNAFNGMKTLNFYLDENGDPLEKIEDIKFKDISKDKYDIFVNATMDGDKIHSFHVYYLHEKDGMAIDLGQFYDTESYGNGGPVAKTEDERLEGFRE